MFAEASVVAEVGYSKSGGRAGGLEVNADTYDILANGTTNQVRLLGVDAPEPDQAFGHQAADSVIRLFGLQRRVFLTRRGVDM